MTEDERIQERKDLRSALTDINKQLAGAAKAAGVTDHEKFQNAGYTGMYLMNTESLKKHRGLDHKVHLLDYMGAWELSAHIMKDELTLGLFDLEGATNEYAANDLHQKAGTSVRNRFLFFRRKIEDEPVEVKVVRPRPKQKHSEKDDHSPS